jgi:hypothetical protein
VTHHLVQPAPVAECTADPWPVLLAGSAGAALANARISAQATADPVFQPPQSAPLHARMARLLEYFAADGTSGATRRARLRAMAAVDPALHVALMAHFDAFGGKQHVARSAGQN